MSAPQELKRPSVLISVIAAGLLIPAHLYMTWVLAPRLIGLFYPFVESGMLSYATSSAQLAADLPLTFLLSVAFLWLVQLRPPPHGTAIAASVAFCAWAAYFSEVGYFSGMIQSEYPWWYEIASFVKYPLAFALSRYLRRRA